MENPQILLLLINTLQYCYTIAEFVNSARIGTYYNGIIVTLTMNAND